MGRPQGSRNIQVAKKPKKLVKPKSAKQQLADEIKAFDGLAYYVKSRLMRAVDRLHLYENVDSRLEKGVEILSTILSINNELYAADLEVKSLLKLDTKLL